MSCEPYGSVIVAEAAYEDQSSSISTVTLYTPVDDGDYFVLVYADWADVTDSDSTAEYTVTWTDAFHTRTFVNTFNPGAGGSGPEERQVIYFHVEASQPIQFGLVYAGNTSDAPFNLYLKVVKL